MKAGRIEGVGREGFATRLCLRGTYLRFGGTSGDVGICFAFVESDGSQTSLMI